MYLQVFSSYQMKVSDPEYKLKNMGTLTWYHKSFCLVLDGPIQGSSFILFNSPFKSYRYTSVLTGLNWLGYIYELLLFSSNHI